MNYQITLLFVINLCSAMGYSLVAPLFPVLSTTRHIGDDLIGWIISVYALFNFAVTPICPILVNKYGRKNVFYFATILEATCTFFYGFLNKISSFYILILFAFVGRIFHGIGSGITATLIYSLTSTIADSSEVQKSLGYMELAWSLGVATGPLLASGLYCLGGYSLPFYSLGLCLYIAVICINFLSLPLTNDEEEAPNFFKAFADLEIKWIFIPVVIFLIASTYYFPSLTNHLTQKWGLSVEVSSLFFVINMLSNFITLQFLDKITNCFGNIITIWIGLLFIILGPIFIYPLAFIPQYSISIAIGLSFLGVSGTTVNVPCIIELARIIKSRDPTRNDALVNDIASAIYNFGINIGDFIGPVLGGFISENYGFKWSNVAISLLSLVYSLIYAIEYHEVFMNFFKKRKEKPLIEETDDYGKIETKKNFRFNIGGHKRNTSSFSSLHKIDTPNNELDFIK